MKPKIEFSSSRPNDLRGERDDFYDFLNGCLEQTVITEMTAIHNSEIMFMSVFSSFVLTATAFYDICQV